MKYFWSLSLILLVLTSCTRVNMDSREYYEHKHKIRHGIIPSSGPASRDDFKPRPLNTNAVARGEVLFQSHCMSCHGIEGRGDGPQASELGIMPPNLQESVRNIPEFTFYMSLSHRKGEMPGWEHPFSDKERSDIAEYLRSLTHN